MGETDGGMSRANAVGGTNGSRSKGRMKANPVRTEVYDTYWRFAAERQAIYFRRLANPVGTMDQR